MPYSKQDLKNLIANGHAAAVLVGVVAATKDLRDTGRMHQSASLLSARWSANELAQQRGTVSNADYLLEKNKVTDALLGLVGELPDGVIEVELSTSVGVTGSHPDTTTDTPHSKPSDFWKKLGYVGLIIGVLAGVVKIVEYFQKPDVTPATEQYKVNPDSLPPAPTMQTSGKQSPVINAPGGEVHINYGSEPEKPVDKKAKN